MTQNRSDTAPENLDRKDAGEAENDTAATAEQVAAYLRQHPDFFDQNPELLDAIAPVGAARAGGVVDLRHVMVERLREELAGMSTLHDDLVVTGRVNLSAQTRVHKAILALLAARNFEHFVETLTTDLAVIVDLDVVTLGVEQSGEDVSRAQTPGVYSLDPGTVDRLVGAGQSVALRDTIEGDPMVFGPGAGLVASDALLRLSISSTTPPALLALGSREPGQFHPGQGTELLGFLARVVESCIRGWLNLPE
ncbi:MAG: DUF484 family protein [Alphaproteobacteria bacterium]